MTLHWKQCILRKVFCKKISINSNIADWYIAKRWKSKGSPTRMMSSHLEGNIETTRNPQRGYDGDVHLVKGGEMRGPRPLQETIQDRAETCSKPIRGNPILKIKQTQTHLAESDGNQEKTNPPRKHGGHRNLGRI